MRWLLFPLPRHRICFEHGTSIETMNQRLFFCLFLGVMFLPTRAHTKMDFDQVIRMIETSPEYASVIASLEQQDYHPDLEEFDTIRKELWEKLLEDLGPEKKEIFDRGECHYYNGRIGYFSLKIKGERPENGYPVYIGLHGGGGAPKGVNDQQWEQMKSYYFNSIEAGIYVAPRGPNNTWNLHFDDDAQLFYHQLLEDLRLHTDLDLNRIYLLGYSAGGDGVYQLAPRMATHLAAANMSAGHHNGISPDNLQHLPMLLQVGELDDAYKRNIETVRYSSLLDNLAVQYPGEYPHQIYVHADAEHSYVRDRQGPDYQASVIADPIAWLENPLQKTTGQAITDGPTWLSQFQRNPYPAHIRWNRETISTDEQDWYWISVAPFMPGGQPEPANKVVEVQLLQNQNRIEVKSFYGHLYLALHESYIDLEQPVVVVVEGKEFEIAIKPSLLDIALCIAVRVDPVYSFWQKVLIMRDDSGEIIVE